MMSSRIIYPKTQKTHINATDVYMKLLLKILLSPYFIFDKTKNKLRMHYLRMSGIEIGRDTFLSPKAYIDAHKPGKVKIGNNCYITRNVVILSHTDTRRGGPNNIWKGFGGERVHKEVIIGDNVFIGVNSVILPGVKIGDNVIVGSLSLVTKDIPAGKIAAGVPAKIIGDTMDHVTGKDKL